MHTIFKPLELPNFLFVHHFFLSIFLSIFIDAQVLHFNLSFLCIAERLDWIEVKKRIVIDETREIEL